MENNNKKGTALYSYCLNPQIKFETHEEGEKIHLLLRSHPFTQIGWVFSSILFFIILFGFNFILPNLLNLGQIFILDIFIIVFILSYIWFNVLNWYFNVGIVTSKRVVDIDFYVVLYKEITVAQLAKIEDITVKSGGFFESFFDYGSIFIQTAGTIEYLEFNNVAFPTDAVQVINKLLNKKRGS